MYLTVFQKCVLCRLVISAQGRTEVLNIHYSARIELPFLRGT